VRALHQQLHHNTIAFTQHLFDAEVEIGKAGDPARNMRLISCGPLGTASVGRPDRS
jgi:hypothetical protein